MNNTSKIILSVLGFAIFALLGFAGTRLIRQIAQNNNSSVQNVSAFPSSSAPQRSRASSQPGSYPEGSMQPQSPAEGINIPSDPIPSSPESSYPSELPISSSLSVAEIVSVSKPVYNEANNTYSFTVSANGMGLTYGLANSSRKVLRTQDTPNFRVQATSSGKYYVFVTDLQGNESKYVLVEGCVTIVKKIDASEFQRILNSGETDQAVAADFKNRVASNCRYEFIGRSEDEANVPVSYNDIILRVKMKTWSSVQVQSVSYNQNGALSRAVIIVNY